MLENVLEDVRESNSLEAVSCCKFAHPWAHILDQAMQESIGT